MHWKLNKIVVQYVIYIELKYGFSGKQKEGTTMDWMDFNRDGEIDAAEEYFAEKGHKVIRYATF